MKSLMGKKKIIPGILVLLAVGGAFFVVDMKSTPKAPPFITRTLHRGTLHRTVTATGRLKALRTVHVGTQVSGIITRIAVDFNSKVHTREILAQIDPAIYQTQVSEAQSNLSKMDTKITLDRIQLSRDKDLLAHHIIARSTYDSDQAQLMMDLATRKQLKAALKLAETDLSYTTIRAPIDGVVISRKVQIGQTVTSAFKTPHLFTIAHDLREMRLDTRVSEADIGSVAPGQAVAFQVPAYPDRTFHGSVTVVRDHPRTVSHVVTYDVLSTVPNPDKLLKPGMTAMVTIHTGDLPNALLVPNGAFVYRPPRKYFPDLDSLRKKHVNFVFLLREAGDRWKIEAVPVNIGPSDGLVSTVTGNLTDKDKVIVRDTGRHSHSGGLFP